MTFHRRTTATGLGLLSLALALCAALLCQAQEAEQDAPCQGDGATRVAILAGRADTPRRDVFENRLLEAAPQAASASLGPPHTFAMTYLKSPAPASVLEGVALRAALPFEDGTASLWRGSFSDTEARIVSKEPPVAVCRLSEDGTFRFEDLGPGAHTVGFRPAHGALRVRQIRMPEKPGPTRRLLFNLGEASVEGVVHAADGHPRRGARVRAAPRRGHGGILEVLTDDDGRYTLDHLLPVSYRISAHTVDPEGLPTSRTKQVHLEPRSVLRLDFGGEAAERVLWGVVRGRDGSAVRGPSTIRLTRADRDGCLEFEYGAHGVFEQAVQPGRYRVHLTLPGIDGETLQLAEVLDLTFEDLHHDFVIPGARVHGSVRGLPGLSRPRLRLRLRRAADDADPHPPVSVEVDDGGLFELHGVTPGRYEIRGQPWRVTDRSGQRAILEVRANQTAYRLSLEAHPPSSGD